MMTGVSLANVNEAVVFYSSISSAVLHCDIVTTNILLWAFASIAVLES